MSNFSDGKREKAHTQRRRLTCSWNSLMTTPLHYDVSFLNRRRFLFCRDDQARRACVRLAEHFWTRRGKACPLPERWRPSRQLVAALLTICVDAVNKNRPGYKSAGNLLEALPELVLQAHASFCGPEERLSALRQVISQTYPRFVVDRTQITKK
jgi:hypothetical protein